MYRQNRGGHMNTNALECWAVVNPGGAVSLYREHTTAALVHGTLPGCRIAHLVELTPWQLRMLEAWEAALTEDRESAMRRLTWRYKRGYETERIAAALLRALEPRT